MKELRNNPTVKAWIKDYQLDKKHKDCQICGFPHHENLICGSTFGQVRIGEDIYSISASNVDYMLNFVNKLGSYGFHWKNEVYFDIKDDIVTITSIWQYNNSPQLRQWSIPLVEWNSIVGFIENKTIKELI